MEKLVLEFDKLAEARRWIEALEGGVEYIGDKKNGLYKFSQIKKIKVILEIEGQIKELSP